MVPDLNSEITFVKMNLRKSVLLYKKNKEENKDLKRSLLIPACTPTPTHKTMAEHDEDLVDYEADSVSG